jgi:hypothetical protein
MSQYAVSAVIIPNSAVGIFYHLLIIIYSLFAAVLRIRDVVPGWRIPKPKTATKEKGIGKICSPTFFCSHKYHKIKKYFTFEQVKKRLWANLQRIIIIEIFTQKIAIKLVKKNGYEIRDPEKNLFRIPGSKRHRILDPQH